MATKPGTGPGGMRAFWTVEEARRRLEDLLAAADESPQEIRVGKRRYRIEALQPNTVPDVRKVLGQGGPLDEDDILD